MPTLTSSSLAPSSMPDTSVPRYKGFLALKDHMYPFY